MPREWWNDRVAEELDDVIESAIRAGMTPTQFVQMTSARWGHVLDEQQEFARREFERLLENKPL